MNRGLIKNGIYLSGIVNIGGILVFSKFFSNKAINEADPAVMSNFGLLMIAVWGLVFIAMAPKWEELKWVIGAIVIEKFMYGFTWTKWLLDNDLSRVYEKDTMAGIFYTIYGPNDWLFFLFFLVVFIYLNKAKKTVKSI